MQPIFEAKPQRYNNFRILQGFWGKIIVYLIAGREYLLINDGLRPEGDIVCVALERLAVGHAEQQTGLGIVHGVLA